jgi:NAD(P)-dependent dehydrogenase (short-subunit alcohol dehydrogenase family)
MGMLSGKGGLVTGAAHGIGRAAAIRMARHGAAVVAVDLELEAGEQTCELIRAEGGEATFLHCDVTDAADVDRLVAHATDALSGRLDFAVNNAGIEGPHAPLHEYPDDGYDAVMAVNLKGVFLCLKAELRTMIPQRAGAIVNTSSIGGAVGLPGFGGYNATKHGVMGLTRTAGLEAAPYGVRVNAVLPGYTFTEMAQRTIAGPETEEYRAVAESLPLRRWCAPAEVGEAIAWLCSDLSSIVVGHGLPVDGGYLAR